VISAPRTNRSSESLGERLRRLRHACGLSQRQLASTGVSDAYISRIESGQRTPSVRAIRVLARKLGVTPEYLESGVDIAPGEALELRLTDAELRLRLGDHSTEARHALEAVLKEARRSAQDEIVTRARIALGLSSLSAGNQRKAAHYLSVAVGSRLVSPHTHTNVYVSLSKALRILGHAEEAVTLLEEALDDRGCKTAEAAGARLRLSTYLSYALTDLGEFERARSLLEELDADAALDPHEQVTMHWSLARLAYMEGQPRAALREIRRAIILLDHTEDSLELARAHLFAAEVHLWAYNVPEAERHLELAARLENLAADARDLGSLHSGQALAHARRGDFERARPLIRRAHEELADAPAEQGLLWLAQALTEAARDDFKAATHSFERALQALSASSMQREAAAVCREWSELLIGAGRHEEAAQTARRAAHLVAETEVVSGRKVRL
jgi:transcriptional regulator with XRE-family HTH domain/cellobiose-specific phosphotransferase system component IIA